MQDRFTAKSLSVIQQAEPGKCGVGEFQFTDHYSVFDFGKMPDQLPGKGAAMCKMAVYNLELLGANGVPTHFRRAVGDDRMQFSLLRVIFPTEQVIAPGTRAYFVPLQVVFRNTLPPGASVFRRLATGQITPRDLGLESAPKPGVTLARPVIEYMTKLEDLDRFIAREDARVLAGLTHAQLERLDALVLHVNEVLSEKARSVGLTLADAKLEFGIDEQREPVLVDVAGTPDETRFILEGQHISKQVLRHCNSGNGLRDEVHRWANRGRSPTDKPVPARLSPAVIKTASDMYKSLCERWVGASLWGAPSLEQLLPSIREMAQ